MGLGGREGWDWGSTEGGMGLGVDENHCETFFDVFESYLLSGISYF